MLTLDIRDREPAICVKDHTVWASDPRAARAYAMLPQTVISQAYDDTVEDFWHDIAPDVAAEYGYTISSDGRSSGWLVAHNTGHWLDYTVTMPNDPTPLEIPPASSDDGEDTREEYAEVRAERDRFMAFAAHIENTLKAAGEMFLERLNNACDDLEHRREACIVRGEN